MQGGPGTPAAPPFTAGGRCGVPRSTHAWAAALCAPWRGCVSGAAVGSRSPTHSGAGQVVAASPPASIDHQLCGMFIPANDPALRSWVPVPADSDFPIQNLPFGIGSWNGEPPVPVSRIGDRVVDLSVLAEAGLLDGTGIPRAAFEAP